MSHPQLVHSAREVVKRDRLLRMPAVEAAVGFRKSTIYAWVKTGTFPRPVQITPRCVAWPESTVLQWVQDRIAGAGQTPAAGAAGSAEDGSSTAEGGAQ